MFLAERINAPDPTELHWVIYNMQYVFCESSAWRGDLRSLKVIETAVPFC